MQMQEGTYALAVGPAGVCFAFGGVGVGHVCVVYYGERCGIASGLDLKVRDRRRWGLEVGLESGMGGLYGAATVGR